MEENESSHGLANESLTGPDPAAVSSRSESTEDQRIHTLDKLDQVLRSFAPHDCLDEDEMITNISQMNEDDKQRQLTKQHHMQLDRLEMNRDNIVEDEETFPLYSHPMLQDKIDIIVDSDFFDAIVESMNEKYFSRGSGQVMDDRELDELRDSLGIISYRQGRRNRKRKPLDRAMGDVPMEEDNDEKESPSGKTKVSRRITRNTTIKRIQEQQRQMDLERMTALIEAMAEAAKLASLKKRSTTGEKKSTRASKEIMKTNRDHEYLSVDTKKRNRDHEYLSIDAKKRNRDHEYHTVDAKKRNRDHEYHSVDTNKRSRGQQTSDMSSNRTILKMSNQVRSIPNYWIPPNQMDPAIDRGESRSIMNRGRSTAPINQGQSIATGHVDMVPTPRLLYWKKRQHTVAQERLSSSSNISTVKPISIPSTIPLPSLQGFDSTVRSDPPRYRHPDILYGTWCSQLIKYLNGPGRLFARYEFFYSDIDRAW